MRIILLSLYILLIASIQVWGAESIKSISPSDNVNQPIIKPGIYFTLPDGTRGIIKEELEDGNLLTDQGLIISPQGVILEGPNKGQTVITDDESVSQPIEKTESAKEDSKKENVLSSEEKKESAPANNPETTISTKSDTITIADLLPSTPDPEAKPAVHKKDSKIEPKIEKNPKTVKENKSVAQPQKSTPPKPEERKVEQKKEVKSTAAKTAPGKELRIPEDAIKTGNLDFLEGCWQGTRPEYYSKRTIKECFCFGKNGKNGKRRVIDYTFKRRCIGSSSASLSQTGILSVTSSGAACNDGERWGQAEMTCRNTGPRTPCSWIFRDAQNGRQSYQIPFIRVNSCGQ